MLKNGEFTAFRYPGTINTRAMDINAPGDIVGFYMDANDVAHGFLLSGGRLTTVDLPGSYTSRAFGINAKSEIVGVYTEREGSALHGFLRSGGRFTSF